MTYCAVIFCHLFVSAKKLRKIRALKINGVINRQKMNIKLTVVKIRLFLTLFLSLQLAACVIVNSSTVLVGEKRLPTKVEDIVVYLTAPSKYEEVAIVQAAAGHDFRSTKDNMDSAVVRLKEEAAKAGANGIILNNVGRRDGNSVAIATGNATTIGGVTSGTGLVIMPKSNGYQTVTGIAIFVTK
jgi:hypothetical protein